MAVNVDVHVSKNVFVERDLIIKTRITNTEYVKDDYPVITLNVREQGVITSTVTLFLDFDQVADLQFELGKLLEEYTTKKLENEPI